MPKYTVLIREVHVSHRVIEADTPSEALKRVSDGEGHETYMEYSHTLEPETWQVDDDEGNTVIDQYTGQS